MCSYRGFEQPFSLYYPTQDEKVKVKCSRCFYKLFKQRKVRGREKNKLGLTPNCRWYESQSKMRMALTGYLKPKESEEKSNDPPPWWYRYNWCDNTSNNRWEHFLTVTTLVSNRKIKNGNPAHLSPAWKTCFYIMAYRIIGIQNKNLNTWAHCSDQKDTKSLSNIIIPIENQRLSSNN